jgi:hypothetical protein
MVTGRIYLLQYFQTYRHDVSLTIGQTPNNFSSLPRKILRVRTHEARISPLLPFREPYIYPCQSPRSRKSIAIA